MLHKLSDLIHLKKYDLKRSYFATFTSDDAEMDSISNVRTNGTHLLTFTDFNLSWSHCSYNIQNT